MVGTIRFLLLCAALLALLQSALAAMLDLTPYKRPGRLSARTNLSSSITTCPDGLNR